MIGLRPPRQRADLMAGGAGEIDQRPPDESGAAGDGQRAHLADQTGEGRGPAGKAEMFSRRAYQRIARNWAPAFAGEAPIEEAPLHTSAM